MTGYELSRNLFDWAFENPNKLTTTHIALYFFIVERCNRLGWKNEFSLPTDYTMEVLSIRSYNTYTKTLNELIEYGFVIMVKKSHNQHYSNIVALSNFDKATDKALDKAIINQDTKQHESNDSIIKHITINKEPINNVLGETSSPTKKPKSKKRKEVDLSQYTEEQKVKFNGFEKWIDENAYNIRSIPEQLNIDEIYRLFNDGYTWSEISKVLQELHNRPEYCQPKKTFSVNLTSRNWMDSNRKREKEQKTTNKNYQNEYTPRISKTEWEAKTGQKYLGQDDPNA